MSKKHKSGRLRKQRKKLWEEDPHCFWCGRLTRLLDLEQLKIKKPPEDMATIDHLESRLSDRRHEPANGERRRVLACWRCNNDRNKAEQKIAPIEKLRRRAQNGHKYERKWDKSMTNEELQANWRDYGVEVGDNIIPIKERYAVCWGWDDKIGGLVFDEGGEQPGICHVYKVDNDNLISVDPQSEATAIIGKLVRL